MDARGNRPPTIAAVAATYEAETTAIARGLGISFTTSSVARFYDRPGIVYVPIHDRPLSHTALAWNPANLTPQAEALVSLVQAQWNAGDDPARAPHDHGD
jgi:DNA-binding transcriptional LysR family regulator